MNANQIYCIKPRYFPFSSVWKRLESDESAESEAVRLFPRHDEIVIEKWAEDPVMGIPDNIIRRWSI